MDKNDPLEIPEEYEGRDLGNLAEDTLRTWIRGMTSVTLNPVESDKEGWDCLLEFPFRIPESGKPWDTSLPRIQCFIQVKGTDGENKERSVKLDNWQKFIATPLPAFFLVFEFAENSSPQSAYLVHVHRKWMERVLERLRKSQSGEDPPLHKQYVTLTWSDHEAIKPLDGIGFVRKIINYIGDDMDKYVQEKQELRRTLGLDAPYLINVQSTFSSEHEMYEKLVDFGLGLEEWLPAKVTVDKDVRFGYAAETTDEENSLLNFEPQGVPFTLVFKNANGSKTVRYPATVYSADFLFPENEIPFEFRKYRIQYELGEIIWSPKEKNFESTFRIDPPTGPIKIRELVNKWSIIALLRDAFKNGLKVAIEFESGVINEIGQVTNPQIPKEWQVRGEAVENAWFIIRLLDLPLDLEVELENIFNQYQEMKVIRNLIDTQVPTPRAITGKLSEYTDDVVDKEKALTLGLKIMLGVFRIFIVVGLAGIFRLTSDELDFELANTKRVLVEHFFLQQEQDIFSSISSVHERLHNQGYNVFKHVNY